MRQVVLLMSGGLDGLLAAAALLERGVAVRPVHAVTGFVHAARRRSVAALRAGAAPPALAGLAPPETMDVREAYLALLRRPPHGHGAGLSACRDCRALMIRRALDLSGPDGAVATGDVLGQRAMDQSRRALEAIDSDAGATGRVLRPLSAALLPMPARIPWAGAVAWPALHGRARGGQRDLARRLGLPFAPVPSGGCCRLADPGFARRLRDCLERDSARPDARCLRRLELGRHIRLGFRFKAVAARDAAEGERLARDAGTCWTAQAADGRGAVVVGEGAPDPAGLLELAAVAARYSAHRDRGEVAVRLSRRDPGDEQRVVRVAPLDEGRIRDGRL